MDNLEKVKNPSCPICGDMMLIMNGAGWDYDRWVCSRFMCDGEIELETTTFANISEEID